MATHALSIAAPEASANDNRPLQDMWHELIVRMTPIWEAGAINAWQHRRAGRCVWSYIDELYEALERTAGAR